MSENLLLDQCTLLMGWTVFFSLLLPLSIMVSQMVYQRADLDPIRTSFLLAFMFGLTFWLGWLSLTRANPLIAFVVLPPFFILISIFIGTICFVGMVEITGNLILDAALPAAVLFVLAAILSVGATELSFKDFAQTYRVGILFYLICGLSIRVIYWALKR